MTREDGRTPGILRPLHAAREDHDAVVKLAQDLVRIPGRGGIDPYDLVLDYMASRRGQAASYCCSTLMSTLARSASELTSKTNSQARWMG